jgi:hypothetical protein
MNVLRRSLFAPLVLAGLLLPGSLFGQLYVPTDAVQAGPQVPAETYPQIVRVSYVQGDVRVSRGKDAQKATGAVWEQAQIDLPLEAGFSLVTGAGRAEIEFEDASTVYLAENSVLVFRTLTSTGGVPQTELGLLSGTATLNVHTMAPGEHFSVVTPTDRMSVRYPDKSFVRVDSYLDAMALTSMGGTTLRVDRAAAIPSNANQTVTFRNGQRIFEEQPPDAAKFADWDQWVIGRARDREDANQAVMAQAGLSAPIPGLAEMNKQGTFYPCAPYGTCWEPTNGWAGTPSEAERAAMAAQTVSVAALQQGGAAAHNAGGAVQATNRLLRTQVEDDYFPCAPAHVRNFYQYDPLTGKRRLLRSQAVPGGSPYAWAVCHTGSWIRDRRHYVWVVGRKRHHHPPLHWVEAGKKAGYVPIHPLDVKGKAPLNLKNGLYRPVEKGVGVEHVAFDGKAPLKLLDEAPKDFRKPSFEPLPRADAPRVAAHEWKDGIAPVRERAANVATEASNRMAGTPITFDRKSQSFMIAREVPQGGGTKLVNEPIGGRDGAVQARSSSSSGGYERGSPGNSGQTAYRGNTGSSYSGGGAAVSHSSPAPAASAPAASAPAAKSH